MEVLEALNAVIACGTIGGGKHARHLGPGKLVESMPEETREALRRLRSEDIAASRLPRFAAWTGVEDLMVAYRKMARYERLKFDRAMATRRA